MSENSKPAISSHIHFMGIPEEWKLRVGGDSLAGFTVFVNMNYPNTDVCISLSSIQACRRLKAMAESAESMLRGTGMCLEDDPGGVEKRVKKALDIDDGE